MDTYTRNTHPVEIDGLVWQGDGYTTEEGHPVFIKHCEQCGRPFYVVNDTLRKPSQYCSLACKQKAWRQRKKQKQGN